MNLDRSINVESGFSLVALAFPARTNRIETSLSERQKQTAGICTIEVIAIKIELTNDLIAVNVIQSISSTKPLQ